MPQQTALPKKRAPDDQKQQQLKRQKKWGETEEKSCAHGETERCQIDVPAEERVKALKRIADHHVCPITQCLMVQPVLAVDGHLYEKEAISRWFATKRTSPRTNQRLNSVELIEAVAARNTIEEVVASGVLDNDCASAWHISTGKMQATGKLPGGTSSAKGHFEAAVALGSAEAQTMVHMLTEGLEVRVSLQKFQERAQQAGVEEEWLRQLLGMAASHPPGTVEPPSNTREHGPMRRMPPSIAHGNDTRERLFARIQASRMHRDIRNVERFEEAGREVPRRARPPLRFVHATHITDALREDAGDALPARGSGWGRVSDSEGWGGVRPSGRPLSGGQLLATWDQAMHVAGVDGAPTEVEFPPFGIYPWQSSQGPVRELN